MGRRRTKRLCCLGRPLARDSRLAAHREVRRHPRSLRQPMRKLGQRGCSSGRPEGRSRGVRADRGRARGSHWLQKSTGGIWPVAPSSEELGDNDVGSSLFARELEVANERRKPNRRWQSREIGGGSPNQQEHAKAILSETLCRWKMLWAGKAVVVDATAVEAVLAPRKAWVSRWSGARQGASEVVRQLRPRSKTPQRGGAAFGRRPALSSHAEKGSP
jgi:hypothetical protein